MSISEFDIEPPKERLTDLSSATLLQRHTCCMTGADMAGWVQDFIEQEGNIELQKKRQDETNERKNAVEAYVYMLRNQLSDALSGFVTEQEQSSISGKLTDTEVNDRSL